MSELILASASPRRKELLQNIFPHLKVMPSSVDEKINPLGEPYVEAMCCALQKLAPLKKEQGVVIACDTIVFLERIIGKPFDLEDARKILRHLSGREHRVISALALYERKSGKFLVDWEESRVTFHPLSQEKIEDYLSRARVLDKAGAYGLQEEGAELVSSVQGDFHNIIGLPLKKLLHLLEEEYEILPESSGIGTIL